MPPITAFSKYFSIVLESWKSIDSIVEHGEAKPLQPEPEPSSPPSFPEAPYKIHCGGLAKTRSCFSHTAHLLTRLKVWEWGSPSGLRFLKGQHFCLGKFPAPHKYQTHLLQWLHEKAHSFCWQDVLKGLTFRMLRPSHTAGGPSSNQTQTAAKWEYLFKTRTAKSTLGLLCRGEADNKDTQLQAFLHHPKGEEWGMLIPQIWVEKIFPPLQSSWVPQNAPLPLHVSFSPEPATYMRPTKTVVWTSRLVDSSFVHLLTSTSQFL